MADHFYRVNAKYGEDATIQSGIRKGTITSDDESLIREYLNEKMARDHVGWWRVRKLAQEVVNFRRYMHCQYRDATITDVYSGITNLKAATTSHGNSLKQNTVHDYIVVVKGFLTWMVENEYSTIPEKKLRGISAPAVDRNTTHPDEILTKSEIDALIDACEFPRDKAIIGTLYETGCRISELARLKWRDVKIDEWGAKVHIQDQKQRTPRYARMTKYSLHLATWREYSGGEDDGFVFTLMTNQEPLTYIAVIRMLARIKKRAGITKRINPHLFRHSRITHMIADNWQESIVKKVMWNNLATGMFQTYVSLSEKDIDAETLERSGLEKKEKKQKEHLPRPCPNCHTVNPPTNDHCGRCGWPLTEGKIASMSTLKEMMGEDPDMLAVSIERFIQKKVKEEIKKIQQKHPDEQG